MRTLYLECSTGVSGDMMISSLSGLITEPEAFIEQLNDLGIPGVHIEFEKSEKCGIKGNRINVQIYGEEEHEGAHHHHHHATLKSIEEIIDALDVSEEVKKDAKNIYSIIAKAESNAHGVPVAKVHFHEVGMLDAVVDIVGTCILMEMLSPEQVITSPVHTGKGHVECMHGILPIPAPATEFILRGIPSYAGDVEGEFCTPTGAALVRYFTDRFEYMPLMIFESVGYGMGKKDFAIANFMRAFIGNTEEELPKICEISCNVDDMYAEDLSSAMELLLENGALDAFITPIIMKKGRPGSMITCICRPEKKDEFSRLLLKYTSTIGVRVCFEERYEMASRIEDADTVFGPVKMKTSEGFGIKKTKPEFEDLYRISKKEKMPIDDIRRTIGKE